MVVLEVNMDEDLVRDLEGAGEEGFSWRYLPIWGFEGGLEDRLSEEFIIEAALPRAEALMLAFLSRS